MKNSGLTMRSEYRKYSQKKSLKQEQKIFCSVSNYYQHLANADVAVDMKNKIIVSRQHFFADMIFSATWKVLNYQNKTRENVLYSNKYVLTTYFKELQRYFQILLYSMSLANCRVIPCQIIQFFLRMSPLCLRFPWNFDLW